MVSKHVWKVGDYAKPKDTVYNTVYRIVEINEHFMIGEIVKSSWIRFPARLYVDPDNVVPA